MFDVKSVHVASSVQDAIAALAAQPDAMPVCGGTDVLVQNRSGRHTGVPLISLSGIEELKGVSIDGAGTIHIGSGTCFTDISNDPIIKRHIPMLAYAAEQVGSPQIRNVGTIGGNVCNGVTSADSAPSLMALDATLVLRGINGERRTPLRDFYTGAGKTTRAHDEILCELLISEDAYKDVGGCYIKYGKRNAMEISTLGCAVTVRLSEDKRRFERVSIAYGVAAPTPIRCVNAEGELRDMPVSVESVKKAAKMALGELSPRTSWRASKEFRLHLARELCERALTEAIIRAGGTVA